MYPDRNTKTIALKWSWKLVSMVKWGVRELLKRQTLQTLKASAAFKSCGFSGYFITYFPFHPAVVIRRNFIGNSDHGFTCQAPATVSHNKYSALCVDSIEGNTAIYTAKHVESGFDLHQDHEKKLLFQLKTMKKCNTYQDFDRMPLHISHQLKHCGYFRDKLYLHSWNRGRTIEWLLERVALYVMRFRHFDTNVDLVMKVVWQKWKGNSRNAVKWRHHAHRVLCINVSTVRRKFNVWSYLRIYIMDTLSIGKFVVTGFDCHMSINTHVNKICKAAFYYLYNIICRG